MPRGIPKAKQAAMESAATLKASIPEVHAPQEQVLHVDMIEPDAPSWRMKIVAMLSALVVGSATTYSWAWVADLAVTALVTMSVPSAIPLIVYFLGMFLAVYLGFKYTLETYSFVASGGLQMLGTAITKWFRGEKLGLVAS